MNITKFLTVFNILISILVFGCYGGFPAVIAVAVAFAAHMVGEIFCFSNKYEKRIDELEKKLNTLLTQNSLRRF